MWGVTKGKFLFDDQHNPNVVELDGQHGLHFGWDERPIVETKLLAIGGMRAQGYERIRMLVDTGSPRTLIPEHLLKNTALDLPSLYQPARKLTGLGGASQAVSWFTFSIGFEVSDTTPSFRTFPPIPVAICPLERDKEYGIIGTDLLQTVRVIFGEDFLSFWGLSH